MKNIKMICLFMLITLFITACSNNRDLPLEETIDVEKNTDNVDSNNSTSDLIIDTETDEHTVPVYMFMLEDRLYVDTGEIEYGVTCGTMDRGFEKTIPLDQVPSENGEANFESEYHGAQFWRRERWENRMVSYVDGQWHIFAYNENSFDGASMTVINAEPTKLTVELTNNLRKELLYGNNFSIEYYSDQDAQWLPVEEICEYTAFEDIGNILNAAATTEVEIDFAWLYGSLEPGEYRIIKDILDVEEPGNYEQYWYMAEFTLE